jgi:dephospho-CoA kinase
VNTAPRVPVIGLTGAIAAGKSEALAALGRLGAETLSADAVVHGLLAEDHVRDRLAERWGQEIVAAGDVDRARVAAIVFERPEELRWLESTLHPLVGERILGWREGLDPDTPMAVIEVPLLFETNMESAFDATIVVIANDDLRAERAGARGTSDLDARAGQQLSQREKADRATFVVDNEGDLSELEAALAEVYAQIVGEGADGA